MKIKSRLSLFIILLTLSLSANAVMTLNCTLLLQRAVNIAGGVISNEQKTHFAIYNPTTYGPRIFESYNATVNFRDGYEVSFKTFFSLAIPGRTNNVNNHIYMDAVIAYNNGQESEVLDAVRFQEVFYLDGYYRIDIPSTEPYEMIMKATGEVVLPGTDLSYWVYNGVIPERTILGTQFYCKVF